MTTSSSEDACWPARRQFPEETTRRSGIRRTMRLAAIQPLLSRGVLPVKKKWRKKWVPVKCQNRAEEETEKEEDKGRSVCVIPRPSPSSRQDHPLVKKGWPVLSRRDYRHPTHIPRSQDATREVLVSRRWRRRSCLFSRSPSTPWVLDGCGRAGDGADLGGGAEWPCQD